jgi:cyclopropane-fatty-acyl-phospholipid synthase
MGRAGSSSRDSVTRSSARDTCVRLLESAGIAENGPDPWSIRVHDERLWERLLADRELALGETYMDGWWDADAPDELITRVLTADLREAIRPSPKLLAAIARAKLQNRQTVGRARRNAQHHYDIGNDLYQRMLDERMVYSCAYWADQPDAASTDLAAAQVAKLDLICRKLHLKPGMCVPGSMWRSASRTIAKSPAISTELCRLG